MAEEKKPSAVEVAKSNSHFLRGPIPTELTDGNDHFGSDSVQLLKKHGVYQQDNRDDRGGNATESGKGGRSYRFMVRSKIPGGKLTSEQLLAELDLCDEFGNGTLRVTTRQGLQLHGIIKGDLKRTIARINEIQLSTLAACGDVNRNVMCTPVPYVNGVHAELQRVADAISVHLCPRTTAYHEIWLEDANGENRVRVDGNKDVEPIYGATYLPRKFKTAVGLPGDNSVDLYANDLGLMAVVENDQIVGYNVLVGGGFGTTPSAAKTFVAVAEPLAFIEPAQVLDVATAIVKVQRDFGNRSDRKVARLKYTIKDLGGLPAFRAKVEEYYGAPLELPRPIRVFGHDDGMGWHEQGDGRWFYGLNIENGRIKDTSSCQLKTALRKIGTELKPTLRLTPHQSIIFCDLAPADRERLTAILREHHVPLTEEISIVRRWSMACPALPTCGLAITESERALPGMIDQLEQELERLDLAHERFTVRMTGCPNGCARPYNSDIGLVGKTKGKYTIYVGGRVEGDRLNFIYKDLVPEEEVVSTLTPLFVLFREQRTPGESFGDFCHRKGAVQLEAEAQATTAK